MIIQTLNLSRIIPKFIIICAILGPHLSCYTIKNTLGHKILYVELESQKNSLESIGYVTKQDCGVQFYSVIFKIPEIHRVFKALRLNRDISYMKNVSISYVGTSHGLWTEHCWVVEGEGFSDED